MSKDIVESAPKGRGLLGLTRCYNLTGSIRRSILEKLFARGSAASFSRRLNHGFRETEASATGDDRPRCSRQISHQIAGHFAIRCPAIRWRHHQLAGRICSHDQCKPGAMVPGEVAQGRAGRRSIFWSRRAVAKSAEWVKGRSERPPIVYSCTDLKRSRPQMRHESRVAVAQRRNVAAIDARARQRSDAEQKMRGWQKSAKGACRTGGKQPEQCPQFGPAFGLGLEVDGVRHDGPPDGSRHSSQCLLP
jgi:hypothetical protein